MEDDGSTYENRKCKCDLERGFYTGTRDFGEFASNHVCLTKKCDAGKELQDDGMIHQLCLMNSMKTCYSAMFYFMKNSLFSDISRRKWILPNMIKAGTALIIFGKIRLRPNHIW